MPNTAIQYSSMTHWLSLFSFGYGWEIPTSTSLALTPPAQPTIKGQGTKHLRLPNVAIFPAEIWKAARVPKVSTNFKSDQHLWKSQLPYSWIKYFFINLTPACLCLETLKITCCMVYCTGKGANRVSKEGKCITVSFQMHFPMGSIQGKGWN